MLQRNLRWHGDCCGLAISSKSGRLVVGVRVQRLSKKKSSEKPDFTENDAA